MRRQEANCLPFYFLGTCKRFHAGIDGLEIPDGAVKIGPRLGHRV
jgi:hypothetical protein